MRAPVPPVPVTPEMRRASWRTFLLILLVFFGTLSVLAALLTWRGREVRLYGLGVLAESRAEGGPALGDCSQVADLRPPAGVTTCRVQEAGGVRKVVLTLADGREVIFR